MRPIPDHFPKRGIDSKKIFQLLHLLTTSAPPPGFRASSSINSFILTRQKPTEPVLLPATIAVCLMPPRPIRHTPSQWPCRDRVQRVTWCTAYPGIWRSQCPRDTAVSSASARSSRWKNGSFLWWTVIFTGSSGYRDLRRVFSEVAYCVLNKTGACQAIVGDRKVKLLVPVTAARWSKSVTDRTHNEAFGDLRMDR